MEVPNRRERTLVLLAQAQRAYDEAPTISEDGVEALISFIKDGHLVVAFRGTQFDYRDIIRDMRAMPWWDGDLGWCHAGFLKGVRPLWPAIRDVILHSGVHPWRVIFTGHSKGAAEATIAAGLMVRDPLLGSPGRLETFGCPHVAGRQLGNILRGARVGLARWVNGSDIVPHVPAIIGALVLPHVCPANEIGTGQEIFEDHKLQSGYRVSLEAEEGPPLAAPHRFDPIDSD